MKHLNKQEQESIPGHSYIFAYRNRQKENARRDFWLAILAVAGILFLLWGTTGCKKKETPPAYVEPVYTPPAENLLFMGGDWIWYDGDTVITNTIHIVYCCEAVQGSQAVYTMNMYLWGYKNIIQVPYFYQVDTLTLGNQYGTYPLHKEMRLIRKK